jgi:hypothetical protein
MTFESTAFLMEMSKFTREIYLGVADSGCRKAVGYELDKVDDRRLEWVA